MPVFPSCRRLEDREERLRRLDLPNSAGVDCDWSVVSLGRSFFCRVRLGQVHPNVTAVTFKHSVGQTRDQADPITE